MLAVPAKSAWEAQNATSPLPCGGGLVINPAMTYFRAVRTIIGPTCLTAVFGMGTGVATWVRSPEACSVGSGSRQEAVRKWILTAHCGLPLPTVFQMAAVRVGLVHEPSTKRCGRSMPSGLGLGE